MFSFLCPWLHLVTVHWPTGPRLAFSAMRATHGLWGVCARVNVLALFKHISDPPLCWMHLSLLSPTHPPPFHIAPPASFTLHTFLKHFSTPSPGHRLTAALLPAFEEPRPDCTSHLSFQPPKWMSCLCQASPTDKLSREHEQVGRSRGQEDVPTLVFVLLFGSFQGFSFLCQYRAFSCLRCLFLGCHGCDLSLSTVRRLFLVVADGKRILSTFLAKSDTIRSPGQP